MKKLLLTTLITISALSLNSLTLASSSPETKNIWLINQILGAAEQILDATTKEEPLTTYDKRTLDCAKKLAPILKNNSVIQFEKVKYAPHIEGLSQVSYSIDLTGYKITIYEVLNSPEESFKNKKTDEPAYICFFKKK